MWGGPLLISQNNKGLVKKDFRAALGFVRLAESTMTAAAYLYAGLFTTTSLALIPWIVPSIVVGVPLGGIIIRHMRSETFRRICMSFDAWIVAFGLSRLLGELKLVESAAAYLVLAGVGALDTFLLYRFFTGPMETAPDDSGAEAAVQK